MKKVIYVSFTRLTDRIARDWYIDYLIANGATVEFWDIVALVREDHSDAGMIHPPYLRALRTYSEVERLLSLPENRDAYYLMLISYGGRFTRIFRLLSKYNCRMLYIARGGLPVLDKPKWCKILNHLCHPLRMTKLLFDIPKVSAYRKLKLIKPFEIIFAAGEIMMANERYAGKVVPINLCDYDDYVRMRSARERLVEGRYAVFLDSNHAYVSDLAISGLPAVTPDTYFKSLNRFFTLVETQYGIRVVIAAHPTASYGTVTFQGRESYRLRTPVLVRDAEFVITHHSTALSYAILNAKPVIFIYTNEMLSLYKDTVMRHIHAQARYLDSPVYNVDEITEGKQIVINNVNMTRYETYKYSFLTTRESEHFTTQDIFWHELNAS
jgi:hypothetical protein